MKLKKKLKINSNHSITKIEEEDDLNNKINSNYLTHKFLLINIFLYN